MKHVKLLVIGLCLMMGFGCTSDFDEINTPTQGFTTEEVSAKFFLTSAQVPLYAPNRYFYWRAQLIHSDRFAGHFCFGSTNSWWNDGLSYDFNGGYTDVAYSWMADYFGTVKSFADLTKPGGDLENEYMYAMSLIIKGLYYQKYTEIFGMVPFSEAGVEGILTPKYDEQSDIYQGIIADLDNAMSIIGDQQRTGLGVADAGTNDIYCGGDLQQWKRLANTLKLRIGMRALGAPDENFATNAITEALGQPLLDDVSGSVVMKKDFVISEWSSSSYGDIWHDFGTESAASFTLGNTLVKYLNENNDPRLSVYAEPIDGGTFIFEDDGSDANFQNRIDFLVSTFDDAGINYTLNTSGTTSTFEIPGGQWLGQPERTNGDTKPFMGYDMFCIPSNWVTQRRGQQVDAYPEIIISNAEAYFLQAEAAVRGIGSGDAQALMASGITEAMKLWGVSGAASSTYIANAPLADISTGTMEEKLEKIAIQRWIASYTDGFEAWAVVRKTGYPANLAAGVSDPVIYALGTLNGDYPQRLRYGGNAQSNPNYQDAISAQGPDVQGTKLWFAK